MVRRSSELALRRSAYTVAKKSLASVDRSNPKEVRDVFDDSTMQFLHGGCSLLVGSASHDGRPNGGRGWGITVIDRHLAHVRLLLDANDTISVRNLQPGAAVAICTADVETLHSLQLKGRVLAVEPATEADLIKQRQYTADFTGDIHRVDGEPLELLHRWAACPIIACVVEVAEVFDQTPGPSAGARVSSTS
jgi:hypothetical protein